MNSNSTDNDEVRVLILNEGEHKTDELYRLQKGWTLQIVLSARLSWRQVRIFTNCYFNSTDEFDRSTYNELNWISPSVNRNDDSNRYVLIRCLQSGTFDYYFTIDGSASKENLNGQGYFQIEPQLILSTGEILRQECLTCQSILSKCLGPMSEWLSRLEVTRHSGYNMIHFTPIQKLSKISNSSYSIEDHHQLNPLFHGTFEQIKQIVDQLAKQWQILSITDLVYNHVANDCALLQQHPEVAYNLINSPHLKPAVLLDSILIQFSRDVQQGKLISIGISSEIKEYHLQLIRNYLFDQEFPRYRLWEYYICDEDRVVEQFRKYLSEFDDCPLQPLISSEHNLLLQHGKYLRMQSQIDFDLAEKIYFYQRTGLTTKDQWISAACRALKVRLEHLNQLQKTKLNENLHRAIENCLSACRYHFFAYDGPKYERIQFPSTPFVGTYFSYPNNELKHPDEVNQLIENDRNYQLYVMAHNGWVMNDDPMRSFADEGQQIYLQRDLIQWSDLIKLRFGNRREDSPALYDYMKEYTRLIATTFHGCRLDNCHSTPLWFAQQMMDYARQINHNFYINAELFTGNWKTDSYFINQIGINSLVRESYRAFDPCGLGQMTSSVSESDPIGSFIQSKVRPLLPSKPYAWFYDQTHDNPSEIERRSVEDLLPRSAIVAMAHCSTGSTRGYDELVPHHIDVVHETRFYPRWGYQSKHVNEKTGIIQIKQLLNKFHIDLAQQGFTQLMVDQLSTSALLINRHNPQAHKSVLLIAHTSFFQPSDKWEYISSLSIEGVIDEILFEASISHPQTKEPINQFVKSNEFINGLQQTKVYLKESLLIDQSICVRLTSPNSPDYTGYRTIEFTDEFRPGSIIALQISLLPQIRQSIINLRELINQFANPQSQFHRIIQKLTLVDVERVLYRTSNEEQSDGKGFDVYIVPDYGPMTYCGLQGQMSILEKIRLHNDLQHPFIRNLKQGNWLMDYIANRLLIHPQTKSLGQWYSNAFSYVSQLSRVMIPTYFDLILTGSYTIVIEHTWSLMNSFVQQSSTFVRALAQSSVQLISVIPNARLPLLSSNLRQPKPNEVIDEQTFERIQLCPSLAAGFPHFASGIWRNWGRDTFISLRGLLLLTGRFEEARYLILSYGGCLRHGLIPNLLGDGKIARYNARDAVWWWLYSICNYTRIVAQGHEILSDKVSRLYPIDESSMESSSGMHDQLLSEVIQEVFVRHIQMLSFRERGAGHSLDNDMNDQGFDNQIGIDTKTGFVFGGNRWNCGTWMDKMGSSQKAGNKGHPATPRDGSAVELVALCRATLDWLIQMNQQGFYPYDSAEMISFNDLVNRIDLNFEKEFWIKENDSSEFVNRTQIYKDTVNSSLKWTDYQFRPNFLVAAVVAPEMFDKNHIWLALNQVESILLGRYGIKTLDPSDLNYIPNYVNDDDSNDYKRAKGFNYHNGPEWLWLMGFYLRAKLYWAKQQNDPSIVKQTVQHLKEILSEHHQLIFGNDWKGLPELTDANGQPCPHSCNVQAWSAATLLEAFYDLTQL